MESDDVVRLHAWENASEDWWMGASISPISREAMHGFVTGNQDLYRDRQLRFMLDAVDPSGSTEGWMAVGAVDLYDFEPRQLRAGVGLHVDSAHRREGHGLAGLTLLAAYASKHLGLHQIYAEVPSSHAASLSLFERAGYLETGRRQAWIRKPDGSWEDTVTLQRFLTASPTSLA